MTKKRLIKSDQKKEQQHRICNPESWRCTRSVVRGEGPWLFPLTLTFDYLSRDFTDNGCSSCSSSKSCTLKRAVQYRGAI